MFAVMILGIGFILVAGIFPVALSQTQSSGDETIASTIAREANNYMAGLPNTGALMVPDGQVHALAPTSAGNDLLLWKEIGGNQILPEDGRYAWIPFYCRRQIVPATSTGNPPAGTVARSDTAQIFVIGVRDRHTQAYTPADLTTNLFGKAVNFTVNTSGPGSNAPDTITFTGGASNLVATGSFVLIANDPLNAQVGSVAGYALKVGNLQSGSTWLLQPGGDLKNCNTGSNYNGKSFTGWIVGQGTDPADATGNPTGGTPDIMIYSSFILLH